MTSAEFRNLAMGLPGASESSHMNHPDFRLAGRIFASLGYPEDGYAMVKLSPTQQAHFIAKDPASFAPSAGAWGRRGHTNLRLDSAKVPLVGAALVAAALTTALGQKTKKKAK